MPLTLEATDKKVVVICGIGLLLVAIVMTIMSPSSDDSVGPPTSYSTKSSGAKAAFLLLQELGRDVHRWTESPTALPEEAANYTLILAEPSRKITDKEKEALNKFVQNGGRVLVTGYVEKGIFGDKTILPGDFTMLSWKKYPALIPAEITRSAPEIEMAERWVFISANAGEAMYGEGVYRSVVVRYPFGKGEIIWWGSPIPLTNAGLLRPGNLELFLNSAGNRAILWDEYFHSSDLTAWTAMKNTPLGWAILQTLLIITAVLLTYSRRQGPIIAPLGGSRLSPLEFVDNLGQLYQRARATPVTIDVAMQRFHLQTVRKLGLEANASRDQIVAAFVARTNLDANEVSGTLAACESARFDPSLPEREALELVKKLQSYTAEFNRSYVRKEKA